MGVKQRPCTNNEDVFAVFVSVAPCQGKFGRCRYTTSIHLSKFANYKLIRQSS